MATATKKVQVGIDGVEPSEPFPTAQELIAGDEELSKAITFPEAIAINVGKTREADVDARPFVSAQDAWNLTMFAKGLRLESKQLASYAERIEEGIEDCYMLGLKLPDGELYQSD